MKLYPHAPPQATTPSWSRPCRPCRARSPLAARARPSHSPSPLTSTRRPSSSVSPYTRTVTAPAALPYVGCAAMQILINAACGGRVCTCVCIGSQHRGPSHARNGQSRVEGNRGGGSETRDLFSCDHCQPAACPAWFPFFEPPPTLARGRGTVLSRQTVTVSINRPTFFDLQASYVGPAAPSGGSTAALLYSATFKSSQAKKYYVCGNSTANGSYRLQLGGAQVSITTSTRMCPPNTPNSVGCSCTRCIRCIWLPVLALYIRGLRHWCVTLSLAWCGFNPMLPTRGQPY